MNDENENSNDGTSEEVEPLYMRSADLAKRYGLGQSSVRRMGAAGLLPRIVINPQSILYPVAECDEILKSYRSETLAQD